MGGSVTLPLWLAVPLAALAAWAALDRLMIPSVRWFVRQRTNRVIEEINTRLHVEIPPFNRTKRQVLVDRLAYDPRVLEAADEHARRAGIPREVAMEKVRRYAREIVPAFNAYLYFRIGYWAARRLARLLYRVRLGYADEAGLAAIERGSTMVFVMNHRSNMDYVLVAYLAASRAALSYAVGEWARIWPLQTLVRSMGAYFIRRNSGNELYRRVLERYVHMATSNGVTQAVYPEGGLSRDGRLRPPKLGLLDYQLRAFDPAERDLVFIPVGINYDRTLEDRTLLLDTDPAARRPGRLAAARRSTAFVARNLWLMLRSRWFRFGYACANFGTPISMRRWCAERGIDVRRLAPDARREAVQSLGDELMAAVGAVIPVLPVALVASVLVARPEDALSELELKARVAERMAALEAAGARLYVPRRDMDYAVTVGLRTLTLRRLVEETDDGLFRPVTANLAVLRYYANSIAHLMLALPAAPHVPVSEATS